MRSTIFLQSVLVVLSIGTFVAAQTDPGSGEIGDLRDLNACVEPCGDKLTPQAEAACGKGAAADATDEQERCVCSPSTGLMDLFKQCVQDTCTPDIVPDVLSFLDAACAAAAANGTETGGASAGGTQTQGSQTPSPSGSPSASGTPTDTGKSAGSPTASDSTTQSPTNKPDGGNAASTTAATAVWMTSAVVAFSAFATMF
ncbi:hypothetical protein EXIGLDRAFT_829975 [Exidia glandulosa HHB12029]|uniref:Extracellular membrane protein CFEM domain-containing protein n=1 Tax=Exidia glandulosa HHB12029 TaxID=1314781 RepID=A0A165P185_EXIGL|nr:hypothetical protein EXIGLDRAFT_829975 [Exidia glandulosa HHB12029]